MPALLRYQGSAGARPCQGRSSLDRACAPAEYGSYQEARTGTISQFEVSTLSGEPRIIYRSIDGRPGCLIFPSRGTPALARRAGGPAFQDSAALVEYRQPGAAGGGCISPTGRPCLWSVLVIYADPAHLVAIVDSVQLHH